MSKSELLHLANLILEMEVRRLQGRGFMKDGYRHGGRFDRSRDPLVGRPSGCNLDSQEAAFWLDLCARLTFAGHADAEGDREDWRGFAHACRLTGLGFQRVQDAMVFTRNYGVEEAVLHWRLSMKPADVRCLGFVYTASTAERPDLLKVGFSRAPERRVKQLRRVLGAEYTLRSKRPGTLLHEWALHQIIRPRIGPEIYRAIDVPAWISHPAPAARESVA